jgi:aspartate aminotransferase
MTLLAARLGALGTENAFRVSDDIARCLAQGMDVVRLNIGEPDFDSAPHINEAAIAQIRAGNSHYTDPQGILPLRAAVAAHVARTRGIAADPARVVITTGGKPSIGYTMQAYVDPGDEVIYPSPGFPIYESWVTYVGAVPVPLPLREESGFTFTAQDLAERISPRTKVIILCSPSNPTGGVLTGD